MIGIFAVARSQLDCDIAQMVPLDNVKAVIECQIDMEITLE